MPTGMDPQKMREMEEILRSLRNKPMDEIIDEIAQMIKSGDAGVDKVQARRMMDMIKPFLTDEQRKALVKLESRIR